jgi:hypothetical protein
MPTLVRRSLNRARTTWRDGQVRCAIAAARFLRASRLGAAAAGVVAREVAVLECRKGPDVSGLFSEFAAVLGFLDHFDRWRHLYAGVRVDFDDGLYYEPAFGPNWWEYYFEPIDIGGGRGAPSRVVSPHYHDLCANRVEREMSRESGAALIDRYVAVKPSIRAVIDAYVSAHWTNAFVVGVHYRGTDKAEDAPRVPYEDVDTLVRDRMSRTGVDRCRIFLATDEQAFIDYMRPRFPGQLLYREMFRSVDGRPIDVVNTDSNHKKGLDAVVDCLLLSRTHSLIRTASNLSLCSTLFNPQLPDTLLNPER